MLWCQKRQLKPINEITKRFPNTYKFCNRDINKFVLLLRKGVHPYEYIDSLGRFNEPTLPNKKAFYSQLNLQDITDKDYAHAKNYLKKLN